MTKKADQPLGETEMTATRTTDATGDGVVSDLDWENVAESVLVAQVLVDQYGADAPLKAEASASRLLLDWADLEAWAYWKRAGKAAEQLLQTEPTGAIH